MSKSVFTCGVCAVLLFGTALSGCGGAGKTPPVQGGGIGEPKVIRKSREVMTSSTDCGGAHIEMMRTSDGDGKITIQELESRNAPWILPKTVPLYDGLKVREESLGSTLPCALTIKGGVAAAPETVMAFHKGAMQGWKETLSISDDGLHILFCELDDCTMALVVSKDGEGSSVFLRVWRQ
jgi:hypothetical protein